MIRWQALAGRIAATLLAGPWARDAMLQRLVDLLPDAPRRSVEDLATSAAASFVRAYPPNPRELADWCAWRADFQRIARSLQRQGAAVPPALETPAFAPAPAMSGLDLPRILTEGDLADWLGLKPSELAWFADPEGRLLRAQAARFRHYRCTWVPKRSGGARLIEAPLPRLKMLQRGILREILSRVPCHPACHGFVAGRNCVDAAALHAGEEMVITADLADFFVSVPAERVHAIFRSLGYPWAVARLLTGLCTTRTPGSALAACPARLDGHRAMRLRHRHLPQGAPTSPMLANLAAFWLDRRLAELMRRSGGRYTRYADDLAFSGRRGVFFDRAEPFLELLGEIAAGEGFRLNPAKTRVMRRGRRQRITGLTVNAHVNLPREEYDRLKAILTNCIRHGPASQNRDGHPAFRQHLEGQVLWAERINLRRGTRLRALFDAIDWDAPAL